MRLTRPLLLLALAALLAPRAEASRTSVWESNPPAAVLTTTSAAGLLAPLAPAGPLESTATNADLTEPPRFDLGDVVLVESPREERFSIGLADVIEPPALRGPPLLDEDPHQAFKLRDPETRIRGFELLPPFRIGASPRLSLWARQACGFSCGEVASDSRYDPWGLCLGFFGGRPCSELADELEGALDRAFSRKGKTSLSNRLGGRLLASPITTVLRMGDAPGRFYSRVSTFLDPSATPQRRLQSISGQHAIVEGVSEFVGTVGDAALVGQAVQGARALGSLARGAASTTKASALEVNVRPPVGDYDGEAWARYFLANPEANPSAGAAGVVQRRGMGLRTVLDPNGKPVRIWGQAEASSSTTTGHADAMNSQAMRMVQSGEYDDILLQRSWRTASGREATGRGIPDIVGVRRTGELDAWEVASMTDDRGVLRLRLVEGMQSVPPSRRGLMGVLEPEPPR